MYVINIQKLIKNYRKYIDNVNRL